MKAEYFIGVSKKRSSFPNLYVLGSGYDLWYAGPYKAVKAKSAVKKEVVNMTNSLLREHTSLRDWEWHHVVETQHMAHIISGSLSEEKWFHMPTILISRREHQFFSRNFNNNAFRELTTIPKSRKKTRGTDAKAERKRRLAIIANMRMMYRNAYADYPTLSRIADNVFNYHLQK